MPKSNYKSTPIPTASIIGIIKTPEIDELIFRKLSTSKIINFAEDNKLILFDNRQNNILSFEYEAFNSDNGIGTELAIRVEIVDPKNIFETQFISIGYKALFGSNARVLEEIQRLQNSKLINESEEAKKLKAKIQEIEQNLKELQDQKTLILTPNEEGFFTQFGKRFLNNFSTIVHNKYAPPYAQKGLTEQRRLNLAIDDVNKNIELAHSLKEEYQKQYLQQVTKDNKNFVDRVNNEIANLEKNCSPSIYFFFGMGNDEDAWAGPIQGNLVKIFYSIGYDGSTRKLTLEYVPQDVLLDSKGEGFLFKGLGRVINSQVDVYQKLDNDRSYKPYPIHYSVTNLLKSFLAKAANISINNVVVLFPDLSIALENKFNTERKAIENTIVGKDLNGLSMLYAYDYAAFMAYEKLYSALGFTVSKPIKLSQEVARGNAVLGLLNLNHQIADDLAETEKKLQEFDLGHFDELKEKLIDFDQFQISKSISLNLNDNQTFNDVIGNFITKLRENSSTYIGKINYFWESDLGIREIFKRYNPNIVIDDSPLLIFGDTNFILNFFYGQVEKVKDEQSKNILLSNLSPFDRTLFTIDFRKHVNGYINDILISNGPFDGAFHELPDEYAYKDTENQNQKNIPIFKYGYKNSNILEFNINYNSLFLAYMQGAIVPSLKDTASITSINTDSTKTLVNKLQNLQAGSISEKRLNEILSTLRTTSLTGNDKTDIRQLGDELLRDFPFLSKDLAKEFATQFVTALKELADGRGHTRNYLTNEYIINSVANRTIQLVDKLGRMSLIANIKTLPIFKYHKIAHILQHPTYIFIREPTILGVKPSIINQLFSGKWNIIGFKHHISEMDCYSAFTVLRVPYDTDQAFTKIKNENTIS